MKVLVALATLLAAVSAQTDLKAATKHGLQGSLLARLVGDMRIGGTPDAVEIKSKLEANGIFLVPQEQTVEQFKSSLMTFGQRCEGEQTTTCHEKFALINANAKINGKAAIVVVIDGTKTGADAATDIGGWWSSFIGLKKKQFGEGATRTTRRVTKDFWTHYNEVGPQLTGEGASPLLKLKLRSLLTDSAMTATDLWIVGHSLGGAVATIAAADFIELCDVKNVKMTLLTFGAPRTFDKKAADDLNHNKLRSHVAYRFLADMDPVPGAIYGKGIFDPMGHVGDTWMIYRDADTGPHNNHNLIHREEDFAPNPLKYTSINWHFIKNYAASFEQLLTNQRKWPDTCWQKVILNPGSTMTRTWSSDAACVTEFGENSFRCMGGTPKASRDVCCCKYGYKLNTRTNHCDSECTEVQSVGASFSTSLISFVRDFLPEGTTATTYFLLSFILFCACFSASLFKQFLDRKRLGSASYALLADEV